MRRTTWLALLLAPFAVDGSTLNTVELSVSPDFCPRTPFSQTLNNNGAVSLTGAGRGVNSSGDGAAIANWGFTKLQGEFTGSGDTIATGSFQDMVTVTPADVAAGAIISGSSSIHEDGDYNPNTNPTNQGVPFGLFTATAQVQAASASPIGAQLTGSAQTFDSAQFPTGGTATFDIAHSLCWAGITGVTYSSNPVSSYTISSASGTDYSDRMEPAAPEPAAWLPLSFPLATAGLKRVRC